MSTEKSLAIVLRMVEFSETSLVVTLFTESLGKISALAKGARRPKSPFESALDLLAVCRIVFLHKTTDTLDLLTEAKLERRFRSATRELSRLYAGYYISELLHDLTDSSDPHPELFHAADQALLGLDQGEAVPSLVVRFELTMLRSLGLLPSLDACVDCGAEIPAVGRVAFGQSAGGILCPKCRPGQKHVVSVSGGVIKALRCYADASNEVWRRLELVPSLRGELRSVLSSYISHLLGRRPRMHKYLGSATN
jgi:DNA repair protein RecO (recombination protein O)